MVVLVLQVVWAVVKLLAGAAILSVGLRRLDAPRIHQVAWQLTGFTFLLGGVSAVVQLGVFAPWAYFAGAGTPVYEGFLRWNPAVTQSRTFMMVGLGALLLSLPVAGRFVRRLFPLGAGFIAGSMLLGGASGWAQGGFAVAPFFSSTAVSNLLEFVVLLSALLVALVADTMDRHLWLALLTYAIAIGLNVLSYSALAWLGVEGAWAPSPRFVQVFLLAAHVSMLGIALRRMQLARRGVRVGSLLEPPPKEPISVMG